MIPYSGGAFGIQILLRVHGSAIYKTLVPALLSSMIYLICSIVLGYNGDGPLVDVVDVVDVDVDDLDTTNLDNNNNNESIFIHPYPITALVAAYTFLLVFRANYSYNRWWEAYTACFTMHSKWLDFATEVAAFHLQSERYTALHMRPPSFGAHPHLKTLQGRMIGVNEENEDEGDDNDDNNDDSGDHNDEEGEEDGEEDGVGELPPPPKSKSSIVLSSTGQIGSGGGSRTNNSSNSRRRRNSGGGSSRSSTGSRNSAGSGGSNNRRLVHYGSSMKLSPSMKASSINNSASPIQPQHQAQRSAHDLSAPNKSTTTTNTTAKTTTMVPPPPAVVVAVAPATAAASKGHRHRRVATATKAELLQQIDNAEKAQAQDDMDAAMHAAADAAAAAAAAAAADDGGGPHEAVGMGVKAPKSVAVGTTTNATSTSTSHPTPTMTPMPSITTLHHTSPSNDQANLSIRSRFRVFRTKRQQKKQLRQQQQPQEQQERVDHDDKHDDGCHGDDDSCINNDTDDVDGRRPRRRRRPFWNRRRRHRDSNGGNAVKINKDIITANAPTVPQKTSNNGTQPQPQAVHRRPLHMTKSITQPGGYHQYHNHLHETLLFRDRFDVATGQPYSIFRAVTRKHLREGGIDPDRLESPLLFLEECAHLLSLLSAVAFSTLRNDLPEADSPLMDFQPGLPWPHVDPDRYKGKVRQGWNRSRHQSYTVIRYLLGASRTDKSRTLYNAARPFRVIGNVSALEINALQEARGPLAKVQLVSMWLQELLTREHLQGSTGPVAPPIISRLYQFISDGMVGYNTARKIAYVPFPFPHAQITTLFVLIMYLWVIPILMLTFVTNVFIGFFLNLFTVMCFTGLHETAREVEAPFQNVPNDVPLNNFQAQFNESLMVMFYGYHPDAYWNEDLDEEDTGQKEKMEGNANVIDPLKEIEAEGPVWNDIQDMEEQGQGSETAAPTKQFQNGPFPTPGIIEINEEEGTDVEDLDLPPPSQMSAQSQQQQDYSQSFFSNMNFGGNGDNDDGSNSSLVFLTQVDESNGRPSNSIGSQPAGGSSSLTRPSVDSSGDEKTMVAVPGTTAFDTKISSSPLRGSAANTRTQTGGSSSIVGEVRVEERESEGGGMAL